ncbi:MAG: FGGY family carbohydrate kinase [Fuerstiella sp.]|nr:FGGY family carbohydrate kinase [Fuerstiella sp.]
MEFIAIDIGTSFTKGAIVDVESMEIRNISRRTGAAKLAAEDPFYFELSPADVLRGVTEIINELYSTATDCCGILMCGQMGGLVLCDGHGKARSNYISWLDRRATHIHPSAEVTYFDQLANEVGDRSRDVLGNEFRPGLPLSFLYYLRETSQLHDLQGTIPVTLPDFVAAALCNSRPVMEWTSTAGTLDIVAREFPHDLLSELRLDGLDWPEIVDFRHVVGEYDVDGRSLPVYAPTGDHQCSLAGTLLARGELSINVSTGSQVSVLTSSIDVGDFQVRPYFDGLLLKTITNIPAGRALTAIMKLLTEIPGRDNEDSAEAWDYFFQQAKQTATTDLGINLAFFPGAVTGPGAFTNLREDNLTVGHIARASLEQMAAYYEQLTGQLTPAKDWSKLVFSGGIAQQSSLLRELVAERLQSEYRTATSSQDALYGMMVLGRVIASLSESVVPMAG